MNIDKQSYAMGMANGKKAATGAVDIDGEITCTDDGEGNITITITEGENNG